MKILIVYTAVSVSDNPFVRVLADSLRAQGFEVVCSVRDFWQTPGTYDIIHLQWPEEVFGWQAPTADDIDALTQQLDKIHSLHIPIVYTRHNTRPHHANKLINKAYRLYEQYADAVVHMGDYSQQEFLDLYPSSQQQHTVIPHHIYEGYYDQNITREQSRRALHIPPEACVILAFGAFRHADERQLVWGAFRRLNLPGKFLLAPRFCPYTLHGVRHRGLKRLANYAIYFAVHLTEHFFHSILTSGRPMIDDQELVHYLTAADVVFIQRTGILNSGNVPLGLSFGKVVTGPACGNIEGLLKQTGNPIFDPHDHASIDHALTEAVHLAQQGKGAENQEYALRNFGLSHIAERYATLYQALHDTHKR